MAVPIMYLLLMGFIVSLPGVAFAEKINEATVLGITGEAQYLSAGSEEWMMLDEGMMLKEGDRVKTAANSEVTLECLGAKKTAELVVRENTEFTFQTFRHDEATSTDATLLNVEIGGVLVKAEKLIGDSKFEVKTPTSIVGIRGTVFEVYASKS